MKRYLKIREKGFRNPVTGKLMPEYELCEMDYNYSYNYDGWFKKTQVRKCYWKEDSYNAVKKIHRWIS